MAVLEQNGGQFSLDDTMSLKCVIETAHAEKDHTEYTIRVQRGPIAENNWTVCKRYSDFAQLDTNLKIAGIDLDLPPKKAFGNMNREFIAERQAGLQAYLNRILMNHKLANSYFLKYFLDASHYDFNIKEKALAHISMFFRSEKKWEIIEPLSDIGWRIRKEYFMVKDKENPKKKKYILSWCQFGPGKQLADRDCMAYVRLLTTLQHPYIHPIEYSTSNEMCGIAIRAFNDKGSLRDTICKAKPKAHYLKKYGRPKAFCLASLETVKLYGRQVLEALRFLHEKGIPYGHLHAGNVIVNEVCRLVDVENWFLGAPSYLRPFIVQFKKIQTTEDMDIYCFAHLIYEMAIGEQLNEPTCDHVTLNCHPQIRALLQSILSGEALKSGVPSLTDVLSNSLFSDVTLPGFEKPVFKIPSKLKENLKQTKLAFEKKLKDEQRVWYQTRKVSQAKDFHMSDEEKRKRRRSKLKQLSQQASEDQGDTGPRGVTPQSDARQNGASPSTPAAPPAATPAGPPAPPPPPVSPVTVQPERPHIQRQASLSPDSGKDPDRGALLGSIRGFSKNHLKRADTVDKSAPKV